LDRPALRANSPAAIKASPTSSGRPTEKSSPSLWPAKTKSKARKFGSCTSTAASRGKSLNTNPACAVSNFRPMAKLCCLWLPQLPARTSKNARSCTTMRRSWTTTFTSRNTFTTTPTPLREDASVQTAYILDVASAQLRKLADTTEYTHTARWSPDGKSIAYLSDHGMAIYRTKLFVISQEGGTSRELTTSFELNAGQPVWSPDGKTIYFSTESR